MITSLHLEDWKSFERSTLYIDPLTVLIGTNASGKSNALDALSFLNRIASGKMLTAALQGDTGLPALRGGIEWAARKPGNVFSLSLVSKSDESMDYEYRLECRVSDNRCDLQAEQLTRIKYRIGKNNTRKSEVGRIMLIRTDPCAKESPTIVARLYNEKQGTPRATKSNSCRVVSACWSKTPTRNSGWRDCYCGCIARHFHSRPHFGAHEGLFPSCG